VSGSSFEATQQLGNPGLLTCNLNLLLSRKLQQFFTTQIFSRIPFHAKEDSNFPQILSAAVFAQWTATLNRISRSPDLS